MRFRLSLAALALASAVLAVRPLLAAETADMAGRTVQVPETVGSVYVMSHSLAIMTALAPELVIGLPFPFRPGPKAMRYLPARYAGLPQLDNDPEALKALAPDLAVGWTTPSFQRDRLRQLDRIGLPTLLVEVDRLDQYPATFRFLGRVLGRAERGEALAAAIEERLAAVAGVAATIPEAERLRVYYAESIDGLTTQCDSSERSDVIVRAGAVNAMHCRNQPGAADNAPIDFETLLLADPDVIVTRFAQTAGTIMEDPRWRRLKAVRNGRVHAVPSLPFSWFDRPPSYMRALGTQWLQGKLYPGRASGDLVLQTKRFYRLFLGQDLTEGDLREILGSP